MIDVLILLCHFKILKGFNVNSLRFHRRVDKACVFNNPEGVIKDTRFINPPVKPEAIDIKSLQDFKVTK